MGRRPFRFGLNVRGVRDATVWADQARRAEDQGYSVLTVSDHFGFPLAPIPALLAAAAATTTLRLGTLVLNNDLRHPVLLAQDIASLDVLSGGRAELGLGAGWLRADYDAAGLPYDHADIRIERLAESVAIIKGLFSDGSSSFEGRHYSIRNLEGSPKPLQRPHPPLLIGGGRRKILSLAARAADTVAVHVDLGHANQHGASHPETLPDATTAALTERLAWVREAAGVRFDQLELQMVLFSVDVLTHGHATEPASPHAVSGTVEQIAEQLYQRRERFGISYFTVRELHSDVFAPVVARLRGT